MPAISGMSIHCQHELLGQRPDSHGEGACTGAQTTLVDGEEVADGWLPSAEPTATFTLDHRAGERIMAAFGTYSNVIGSLSFNTSLGRTLASAGPGGGEGSPFAISGRISGFRLRGGGTPRRVTGITFLTDSGSAKAVSLQLPQPLPPANQTFVLSETFGVPGGDDIPWDDGATWDGASLISPSCSLTQHPP